MEIPDPPNRKIPVAHLPRHPEEGSGLRQTVCGVVVEMGMGYQAQIARYAWKLTGEPVAVFPVPVGVNQHPGALASLPKEGTVAVIGDRNLPCGFSHGGCFRASEGSA